MSRPIKIVHISSAHRDNDVRIFYKECVSLASQGYDVTLVIANGKDRVEQGVKVVGVADSTKNRFVRAIRTVNRVYRKALELNADVYHLHDPELLRISGKLKGAGKRVVYDAHEDLPRQVLSKGYIPKLLRKWISAFVERYENKKVRALDGVVAATPFIRDRFSKINANAVAVNNFPLLAEFDKVESNPQKKVTRTVCYIGSISEVRGIYELIMALPAANCKLILAGEFNDVAFQKKLEKLPEWKHVNFVGYANREEVTKILAASDLGMVTLHPIVNYMDALPVKLFEYMAAGVPVVASNFPLWQKIVSDSGCGICVDPKNSVEISSAINTILADQPSISRMALTGRDAVWKEFNWLNEEKKLIEFYGRLTAIFDRRKRRVVHVTSAHKYGDVRIFHKQCASLAKEEFQVFHLVPNAEDALEKNVYIKSFHFPITSRLKRMLYLVKEIRKRALDLDAEIYHLHDPELLRIAGKLKRAGKKVIYDAHEDVPRDILTKQYIPAFLRGIISRRFERFENKVVSSIDGVVAATPFIRDRFLKVNPQTIDINNYPILDDGIVWTEYTERPKKNLCYLGVLVQSRGIVELVEAVEKTECRLLLAGEFREAGLEEKLKSMAGWDKTTFYGFLNRAEVNQIYNESRVGIVTLYPLINFLDSLPVKMFEYMAAGIPVIASDFPYWKKIVEEGQCGICVDPKNPDAIAAAIRTLLENEIASKEMGERGRRLVHEVYNWDIERKKLVTFYQTL